jgi:hypothetical protein
MTERWEAAQDCRAVHLINVAARATHCADGDNSTFIDSTDLVELVAEILGDDAADDAHANIYDIASEALNTFHFQIVVDQDHADALRAGDRYVARIVDVGHALPTVTRLYEALRGVAAETQTRIMSASALRNLLKREPTVGCYIDEFVGLMNQIHDRKAGIHNAMIRNDLLSLFTEAGTFFAGTEYAAAPAEKIMAPNLSINGTSTPSQFWGSLASMSGEDGLLARMILLDVKGANRSHQQPVAYRRTSDALALLEWVVSFDYIFQDPARQRVAEVHAHSVGAAPGDPACYVRKLRDSDMDEGADSDCKVGFDPAAPIGAVGDNNGPSAELFGAYRCLPIHDDAHCMTLFFPLPRWVRGFE